MTTKLLKAGDIASILNISRGKAFSMMSRGDLPVIRFGGSVRVKLEDLEQFIEDSKRYAEKNDLKVQIAARQERGI